MLLFERQIKLVLTFNSDDKAFPSTLFIFQPFFFNLDKNLWTLIRKNKKGLGNKET